MTNKICIVFALLAFSAPARADAAAANCAAKPSECATAKNANECADILKKLGKNPFDAFGVVGCEQPVYGGQSETPAAPCKNGAASCEPWERDWSNTHLQPGSTVTDQGTIFPPPPSPIANFLYNWQTLITGGLAIIAAIIGAVAAYHAGHIQVAAARRKTAYRRGALPWESFLSFSI